MDINEQWRQLKELAEKHPNLVIFTIIEKEPERTVTGRIPTEPELQNIRPRDHAKPPLPFFTIYEQGWGSKWEHHGTVIGRMRSNQPSFQCIAKDHPKLTFLDVINDDKRLDVWKDDFKMISEINVGKYCIDEIIKEHKRSMILILNDVSKVRTRGDLK